MGEGRPALPITPEFYRAMHERVRLAGGLLLVDSVQAGVRCHGVLSVTDYPGFEQEDRPDMETFAKAINAGQYPVSMLALGDRATRMYRAGLYGNTMSGNARALDVVRATLEQVTPELRQNIRDRGRELVDALRNVCCPSLTEDVRGVGMLVAVQLRPGVIAADVERSFRSRGLNVIHGGANSIRLTPWFHMSSREVQLVAKIVSSVLGRQSLRRAREVTRVSDCMTRKTPS